MLRVDTCWNDEFLCIEAVPAAKENSESEVSRPLSNLSTTSSKFSQGYERLVTTESERLSSFQKSNLKVVAWGAGARAVTYFNILDTAGKINYIVDINEKRQHKFLPGAGIEIVEPKFLQSYKPDVVIITNPTYAQEIRSHIHDMGLDPEIYTL